MQINWDIKEISSNSQRYSISTVTKALAGLGLYLLIENIIFTVSPTDISNKSKLCELN